ncbi:MAG: hypothetical protein ACRD0L_10805 [Acidimicrobiales bacterium]
MATVLTNPTPTRATRPGTRLRLICLSSGPGDCAGIDVDSGAFVRGRWEPPADPGLRPYEFVTAVIAGDDGPPDLARPEGATFEGPPEPAGRLPRRRVRRHLRALAAPTGRPLLGFPGPAIAYWLVPGTHPSLALVRPSRGPQLVVGLDGAVKARFEWDGLDHCLPVLDRRVRSIVSSTGRPRLAGDAMATVLGHRVRHVLVALADPEAGHCHKSVAALLPPP